MTTPEIIEAIGIRTLNQSISEKYIPPALDIHKLAYFLQEQDKRITALEGKGPEIIQFGKSPNTFLSQEKDDLESRFRDYQGPVLAFIRAEGDRRYKEGKLAGIEASEGALAEHLKHGATGCLIDLKSYFQKLKEQSNEGV